MLTKSEQTKQLQTILSETYGINLPLDKLNKVIDAYFLVIREAMLDNKSVQNPIFGKFIPEVQSERKGVHRQGILKEGDPRIGKEWVRPAHLAVRFKPSAEFKAMLLNSVIDE